jgi:hypothetical protein
MSDRIKGVVGSPLLHFLAIGAAIYVAFAVASPDAVVDDSSTIRVTTGDIEWMETSWLKRWNRPPTPEERQGLIDAHVRETVLYREALAMGLDADDVIIRRRLAQKLEFLFEDLVDAVEPTDEELIAYFLEHREQYRAPEVMTFTHVFIDPDRRGDRTLPDADEILARLQAGATPVEDAADLGDRFMLQAYYPERSEAEVARLFGREFARSIFSLDPHHWHGPVLSGYGTHLVYVHGREQAPPAEVEDVRERVAQDRQTEQREAFNEQFVTSLMDRYEVIIEDPEADERVTSR